MIHLNHNGHAEEASENEFFRPYHRMPGRRIATQILNITNGLKKDDEKSTATSKNMWNSLSDESKKASSLYSFKKII